MAIHPAIGGFVWRQRDRYIFRSDPKMITIIPMCFKFIWFWSSYHGSPPLHFEQMRKLGIFRPDWLLVLQ
jgi:hypothetical protein